MAADGRLICGGWAVALLLAVCPALGQVANAAKLEQIPLAGGKLALPTPGAFELLSRDVASTALSFRSRAAQGQEAGAVLASLTAQPQRGLLTSPTVRKKLIDALLDELRAEGKAVSAEILTPAAIADDPDLFARVTDTIKSGGKTSARSKSVRLLSGQLVGLYVVATHPDAEKRKVMLAAAEAELLKKVAPARAVAASVTKSPAVVAKEARIRFLPPSGYRATLAPTATGVVATLTSEAHPERRIVVTVVNLEVPPGQSVNREVIGTAADRAIELETEKLTLPSPLGEFELAVDSRFFRRQRRFAGEDLARVASDSRQIRLGNVVVSVAMACPEDEEEETARAADTLAESVEALRR